MQNEMTMNTLGNKLSELTITVSELTTIVNGLAMTISEVATAMQAGFTHMEQRMATKGDMRGFATKEDLQELESRMASKDDLKKFESRMATKEDLRETENRLSYRYNTRVDRLEDDMRLVKSKLNLI